MRKRLLASFLCLCLLVGQLPTMALAAEPVELDIGQGSIIITENGYSQGVLAVDGTDLIIKETAESTIAKEETTWPGAEHALTITGTSSNGNMIVIKGGDPAITLGNVSITATASYQPALLLYGGTGTGTEKAAKATVILEGNNTLIGGEYRGAAIQINQNATLTIRDCSTGGGSLTATGRGGFVPGIGGGFDATYAYAYTNGNGTTGRHNNYTGGGNLVIESGVVDATGTGRGTNQRVSAIGTGYRADFGSVTIKGGTVITSSSNNGSSISANDVSIEGGLIQDKTTGTYPGINAIASFHMSGGTILGSGTIFGDPGLVVSVTGGNIGGYYNADTIDSRAKTELVFFDKDGGFLKNAQVTVTEGSGDNAHTWTALTDANGMITTYLANTTESITVKVGDDEAEKQISISNGQGIVGAECTCGTTGTLAMLTPSQDLEVIRNEATLKLSAQRSGCVLPEGFHGDYEDISYEVVSVTVGETPVEGELSAYASISVDTLTVNRVEGVTDYTVQVQAEYGPEGSKKTSEPIDINVSVYQSEAQEGELDIYKGTITVTAGSDGGTIYTQDGETVKEAASGEEVTITGSSTSNQILVQSGNPTIRLKNVSLTNASGSPISVSSNAVATVVLEGNNTLKSANTNYAALEIGQNSTVNIQVPEGQPDSYGTLNATGGNESAGIGGSRAVHAGTVNIKSGTIVAKGGAYASGIGPGRYNVTMQAIHISGGHITNIPGNTGGNYNHSLGEGHGKITNAITISGGYLDTNGVRGTNVAISGGTIVMSKNPGLEYTSLSITGGNICDNATYSIPDRTRTELVFFNQAGEFQKDTEVTVTEGEHTWSARTDANGIITTYLANGTTSISATVGEATYNNVAITNGQGVVGAECTCAANPGALTMNTKPQALTAINGSATLGLDASYTKGTCVLPDGFHGDYENISYEITQVVKNGQYMVENQYAKIEGNTLTVYGETNQESYTVYVRAKSGPNDVVKSSEIAITVNTHVSGAGENELDITEGSITITSSGYKQGNSPEVSWGAGDHALTITGSSTSSQILVQSGNPTIRLKNVSLTNASGSPISVSSNAVATVVLEGNNTLKSANTNYAALEIGQNSTVNIQVPEGQPDSYGTLNATGGNESAGIGGSRAVHAGTVNIKSGTIVAKGGAYASGIGPGRYNVTMQAIHISGGHITNIPGNTGGNYNHSLGEGHGDITNAITISGGYIDTNGVRGKNVTISGGTIVASKTPAFEATTLSITGGNIGDNYSGTIAGRELTKLYFVEEDGTPKANMEVTVAEGENEWTALTDENGVITTYLASDTKNITVSYESQSNVSVTIPESHLALIGGSCSCSAVSGITWETGLPESITLHNLEDETHQPVSMNYDVPAAQLVTDSPCGMPIHPELPVITYDLSAVKDGNPVGEDVLDQYAKFSDYHLTLLPGNAPYTVTLTATADGKTVSASIEVEKGDAGSGNAEISTINLSLGNATISYHESDNTYSYAQGGNESTLTTSGTFLITGFAPNGSVTVEGGSPTLIINQNDPNDEWNISTDAATLNIRTINGTVNFGSSSTPDAARGVLTSEKIKLNPETEAGITVTQSGSITQGNYTITGVGNRTLAVYGANLSEESTITNNSSNAVTVDVNDNVTQLSSGGSITIPQAQHIFSGNEGNNNTRGYIYDDGTKLVYAGKGTASGPVRSAWNEEPLLTYRSTVTQVAFDPNITVISGSVIYLLSGIERLEVKYATAVDGLYNARIKSLWLGKQVTAFTTGNYLFNLETIEVEEGNTAFLSYDGVLYTSDGTTLLQCPTKKTGSHTLLDTCETISSAAFSSSRLSSLTLNANLAVIGGRAFEDAAFQEIHVAAGSTAFKSVDGALYTADGKTLILCPMGREAALVIPEGVTAMSPMAVYNTKKLTSITLPSTLKSVDTYFLAAAPIEEMTVHGMLNQADTGYDNGVHKFFDSQVLRSLTVPDGYDFANSNLFTNTSMNWVTEITITGGEDVSYDGTDHGINVIGPEGATVKYSTDGETWLETSPACKNPGNYTVYWQLTYEGGTVYSQADFTITALEADESWFILSEPVNEGSTEGVTPVTLNQPAAAPSLEDGYTVKYGESTDVPTAAGSYLVTVEITKEGYANEALTLGYYTILSAEDSSKKVLSFVTNGGTTIEPIIETAEASVTKPADPTRTGYIFEGWYSDAALRTKVESFPATMPSENATYYAKWARESYTITYNIGEGAEDPGNPVSYHVETPTFTLIAPTKPGYEFTGWTWDGQTEPQTVVTVSKGSTGARAYTAHWEMITYTITYPNSYDQVEGSPISYTVDDTGNGAIPLTAPVREGYTFAGWTMVVDGIPYLLPATGAVIPQGTLGDITLTGIWMVDEQTLTLDANGGKFDNNSGTMTITADYASSINLSDITPIRGGYQFAGWYTDEACTTPFTGGTMPLTTTIYAKWNRIYSGSTRHSISAAGTENGTVTISHKNAVKGTTVTVTVTPDDGYVLNSLVVVGTDGNALQLHDLGKGVYTFKMPGSKVTVTASFEKSTETPTGPFVDVSTDAYYYDAVLWAVENGITNGTNAAGTTFSPDMDVTRAQAVTFLYRELA